MAAREPERRYDWAGALCKATKHRVNREKGPNGRNIGADDPDRWSEEIGPRELRAIMECQNGRCALDRGELEFPADVCLPKHTTLKRWARAECLARRGRLRMPLLVRVSGTEGWTIGNVAFIASMYREIYEYYGSAGTIVDVLGGVGALRAPSRQSVDTAKRKIFEKEIGARHEAKT